MAVGRVRTLRALLPEGRSLPDDVWRRRHGGMLVLLWLHAAVIPVFAAVRGFGLGHVLLEGAIVPSVAALATAVAVPRRLRTAAASVGLLTSSAVLVHLSGGLIEMHFHFFVMVTVVALYQDWLPFLAAVGYVLVHHGVVGALYPALVYNHQAALNNPWKWAGIHSLFIAGISSACLVTWRLNESMMTQRRRAEARLRRESRLVERLNEVGMVLSAELDPRGVMQRMTDIATDLTSAGFGAFFYNVDDGRGGSYLLHTLSGAPQEAFEGFPAPRKTALFAATFDGDGIVRSDDVTADPRYGKSPPHFGMPKGHLPVRSYLAVPVRSRAGVVLGGLFFGHQDAGVFTQDDERIAAGIAAHAAVAIDTAKLYESERRAREASERAQRRLEVLADASRALTSSLEVGEILERLAAIVAPAVADTCVVYLREDDGSLRAAATGADPSVIRMAGEVDHVPVPADETSPVMVAMRDGRAQLFEEVTDKLIESTISNPGHLQLVRRLAPTSAIIVPLAGRRGVFGVVAFGSVAASGRRLTADDLGLAEEIARRAAIAVENARLFAAQRTAAETLQRSLLPERLPSIPGIETAVRYIPGGPGVDVGGDWYDVLELQDGSLGLVMGDVVGRGITAAALMGQLRNAWRAFSLEGHAPAVVASRLNAMLRDVGPSDAMATIVHAVFDPETGTLRITNAGHPPPLIVGADGTPVFFESALGPPIGATARATYPEAITTLAPGATILFYTDGLVEDRRMPLDVGLDRLRRAVRRAPEDLEAMCDSALNSMLRGREVKDDVAILAMRAIPLGSHLTLRLPARPSILRPLRSTLRHWLAGAGATEQEIHDVVVACGEACTNAIQHPSRTQPDFFVEAEIDGEVRICVRDAGPWRVPRKSLGGRGLAIMRSLMDDVDVRSGPEGTEVRMRKALAYARTVRPV